MTDENCTEIESEPNRDPRDVRVHGAPEAIGAEIGMLVVATIAKIRRAYFVRGSR
jgi:hypothetical protein